MPPCQPRVRLAGVIATALAVACGNNPATPTSTMTCDAPVITGDSALSTPPRCLLFAGRPWLVKSKAKAGINTNAWSDLPENVWTDSAGLHLAVTQRAQRWYSAEVTLNDTLGYGTYSFRTDGRLDQLDQNAVLGLFTYDYADAAASYREMDIEYGMRLGAINGANGHFAVHPISRPGSTRDFVFAGPDTDVWHHIDWRAGRVTFTSGTQTFTVTGAGVPVPGRENVRMNLWLYNGEAPVSSTGLSMVISDFRFAQ